MEKLALILAILNLPIALFFTVAKISGGTFWNFIFRGFGIASLVVSTIIVLKSLGLI